MGLKLKISILHILVSFVTIFFIYMIYDSYIVSQKKDIETQLMKILKLNEDYMKKSLSNIEELLESKKSLSKELHLKIHERIKRQRDLSLLSLQKSINKEFALDSQNLEIEIFLVDRDYIVVDSTHKKNIGLDLKNSQKSKNSLDKLKKLDQYISSKDVAVDFLDYEMKSFSYSKLAQKSYLGMGIIYKDSINERKNFNEMREIANTNMNLFCVMKDSYNNQYYESLIAHRKKFDSNEEYLKSKEKFPLNKKSSNLVIKTSRLWEVQNSKVGDTLSIFLPLMREKNPIMAIPGDIILQVDLDISEQNRFIDSVLLTLIIFILLHFFLVFIIFYFTNKYQKIEKKLKEEIVKNEELIEYNKQFISNLVHQIRTPFSIIMTNISFLEELSSKKINEYALQINASINMLSNSYENLSYFVSYKSLNYPKRRVDLSKFLKDRVEFFDHIAYANKKSILTNIEDNIIYEINDMELERVVDNSISNALYFCNYNCSILISLMKNSENIVITFKVINSRFQNMELFEKEQSNYIKDMSSLGLGTHLIKEVCSKNSMTYSCEKKGKSLTFEYEI